MPTDDPDTDERTTIRPGRNFEREYRLDASDAGEFLIALGEQLRDGEELTIGDDEWVLPFAFGDPVALEIDFDGMDEPELEIELELPGRTDETGPRVE
ncbi:amphi-Trp domain-containing protein [Natronorubrum sp. FCH18a]|uniref:amphi-Trp domain-containing protein n=1 Tax=Natronorubrum sp. FCH18a TaxID=3447018 RepID=UPI003F519F81